MLAERNSQCSFQDVAREHHTSAGFGQAARDHGAAFPCGGVTAAPVECAEFFQFRWPGLRKIAEPRIYHEATGEEFPIPADDDNLLRGEDWQILKEVCGEDPMFFELQSSLLDVKREYRGMSRRAGIYEALEDRFKACQFESEQEALAAKQAEEELRKEVDKENERSLAIVQKSLFGEEEGDGV